MDLRMSMQVETPEPKLWENSVNEGPPKEESQIMKRRVQRNLMAAAAEKRMMSAMNDPVPTEKKVEKGFVFKQEEIGNSSDTLMQTVSDDCKNNCLDFGLQLSPVEANQLFSIVFGGDVTKGILAQWSNQGIRFSPDRETSMGLVQHEGGPRCVLASIQDCIQAERDDPTQPLVTAPLGHASQEIVNLLLCGEAVAHLFDGQMDLGGGMSLKGISNNVEVGFLTLLESLNFCKVGQFLKCPKWPIWVVGSE